MRTPYDVGGGPELSRFGEVAGRGRRESVAVQERSGCASEISYKKGVAHRAGDCLNRIASLRS
jgi:hypothetical protein